MKLNPKITNRALITVFMTGLIFTSLYSLPWDEAKANWQEIAEEREAPVILNPFANINLDGSSAIVLNAETGEIVFSLEPKKQMPLASITKVMTAVTAMEMSSADKTISVNYDALRGGSNAGLGVSRWMMGDLLDFSLVTSSNGASMAIAENLKRDTGKDFMIEMNNKAKAIGLNDSYFINPTGLDVGGNFGGSYSTATDIANLFVYALKNHPGLLEATKQTDIRRQTLDGAWYTGYNTNQEVVNIPGIIASKTGFTDAAGGNLAVAFDAGLNQPFVVVVLDSSRTARFEDVKKLVNATIRYNSLK